MYKYFAISHDSYDVIEKLMYECRCIMLLVVCATKCPQLPNLT